MLDFCFCPQCHLIRRKKFVVEGGGIEHRNSSASKSANALVLWERWHDFVVQSAIHMTIECVFERTSICRVLVFVFIGHSSIKDLGLVE